MCTQDSRCWKRLRGLSPLGVDGLTTMLIKTELWFSSEGIHTLISGTRISPPFLVTTRVSLDLPTPHNVKGEHLASLKLVSFFDRATFVRILESENMLQL